MENLIKMDDLGVPRFLETPICCLFFHHFVGASSINPCEKKFTKTPHLHLLEAKTKFIHSTPRGVAERDETKMTSKQRGTGDVVKEFFGPKEFGKSGWILVLQESL